MNKGRQGMTPRLLAMAGLLMLTGLSGCAGTLLGNPQAGGYPGTHTGRSHAQISADGAMTSNIESRFRRDDVLSTVDIQVNTYNNVVTLYGYVASRRVADRAVSMARAVNGVSQVISKLAVTP